MNYIDAEEFLRQSEKVQGELLEWWEPQMLDLYFTDFGDDKKSYLSGIFTSCIQDNDTLSGVKRDKRDKPLLQMHQLIKFLEDKIGGKVDLAYYCDKSFKKTIVNYNDEFNGYTIQVIDKGLRILKEFNGLGYDLLQALWKAVIEIAECQ